MNRHLRGLKIPRPKRVEYVLKPDQRVFDVRFTKEGILVTLTYGRTISAPLVWYPRLLNATKKQRERWQKCAAGYGIHWPDIDEDLSTEGLLRGAPAPRQRALKK